MKYCRYCGNKLNDDDRFCTACGGKCEDNSEVKVETVNATIEESPYVECKICGARVDRGEYSCPVCGAPLSNNTKNTNTNSGYNNYRPASNEKSKMATAGMILGIIGACLISLLLSVLGLIFGIIGLTQVNSGKGTNKGQALAGIILGAVGIVLYILFQIFVAPALEEYLQQLLEQMQNGGGYGIKVMLSILLQ